MKAESSHFISRLDPTVLTSVFQSFPFFSFCSPWSAIFHGFRNYCSNLPAIYCACMTQQPKTDLQLHRILYIYSRPFPNRKHVIWKPSKGVTEINDWREEEFFSGITGWSSSYFFIMLCVRVVVCYCQETESERREEESEEEMENKFCRALHSFLSCDSTYEGNLFPKMLPLNNSHGERSYFFFFLFSPVRWKEGHWRKKKKGEEPVVKSTLKWRGERGPDLLITLFKTPLFLVLVSGSPFPSFLQSNFLSSHTIYRNKSLGREGKK